MKSLPLIVALIITSGIFAQAPDNLTITAEDDSIKFILNGEVSAIANTDMAAYYLAQGIDEALKGEYESAESKFRVALLYDLTNAEILYNLGLAQYLQDKFYEAISTFDAAATYDPENENIYNQRGLCKARNGDFSAAELDFKIMLKYDPTFAMGIYNYGILKLQMGETNTACELLNSADSYGYENAPNVIATYCN